MHCYAPLPSNNICDRLFSIVHPSHCLLWPSLLLNMSGRKHLRCSLALFAPAPDSNHLAKLRPRNCPQIGPFLGQNCLFVGDFFFQCPNQCWPFIGILWQPARNHSIWVAGVCFLVIYTSSIISNADVSRKKCLLNLLKNTNNWWLYRQMPLLYCQIDQNDQGGQSCQRAHIRRG